MTVDGQTFRQSLEVKMDPRVNYARYELESSLDLELRISATLGRNFAAYQQVKDLRSRLAEFAQRAAADPVATAAAQLDSKAEALEGKSVYILDTPKGGSFITVNDSLVSLIGLVDGADFAPSAESFAALQRVCAAMNGTLEEWQKLKDNELAAFRKLVETQKSGAIPDYPAITVAANCGR